MGPVIALHLALNGARVRYVTTEGRAGAWSQHTVEQERCQAELLQRGVAIDANATLDAFESGAATLACVFTARSWTVPANAVVLVTSREPDESLYRALVGEGGDTDLGADAAARVLRIGDCRQPGLIVHAVYSGHQAARALGRAEHQALRDRLLL